MYISYTQLKLMESRENPRAGKQWDVKNGWHYDARCVLT